MIGSSFLVESARAAAKPPRRTASVPGLAEGASGALWSAAGLWRVFVSNQLDDGQVKTLCIESEKGRPCTVDNPWPRRRVRVHQKGKEGGWEIVVEAEGTQVRFATRPGGIYRLEPAQ